MRYEVFEGEKAVNTVRLKRDKDFFDNAIKKLGFKNEIDLVTFCASIALYKECIERDLDKMPLSNRKKLVGMETFDKRKLYDFLILNYLEIKEKRLEDFEKYFYTGFNILRRWFEKHEPDTTSELERFSSIWDYMTKESD